MVGDSRSCVLPSSLNGGLWAKRVWDQTCLWGWGLTEAEGLEPGVSSRLKGDIGAQGGGWAVHGGSKLRVIRSTGRTLERGSFLRAARIWSGLASEVWDAGAMGVRAERPEGTGRRVKGTFEVGK